MSQKTQHWNQSQQKLFDPEKALDNVDGDREVFQSLVHIFVEESSNRMEEIREGVRRADANAVEKAAHSIKGTVGNFAAKGTFELASRLEVLAREGRLGELETAFTDLEREMNSLREALLDLTERLSG